MTKSDYEVKYPLDVVSVEKFAELLGKPETAVRRMIASNKLPVVELIDPEAAAARVGERWVVISEFNRRVLEAYYKRPAEERDAWLLALETTDGFDEVLYDVTQKVEQILYLMRYRDAYYEVPN